MKIKKIIVENIEYLLLTGIVYCPCSKLVCLRFHKSFSGMVAFSREVIVFPTSFVIETFLNI